jgi:hypothetical protein
MTDDETALNTAKQRKYYVVSTSWWGGGRFPGLEVANKEKLLEPPWCATRRQGDASVAIT